MLDVIKMNEAFTGFYKNIFDRDTHHYTTEEKNKLINHNYEIRRAEMSRKGRFFSIFQLVELILFFCVFLPICKALSHELLFLTVYTSLFFELIL